MPAVIGDVKAPEREGAPGTVVYTTLYDLIATVSAEIEPGEEECVAPIVVHLLRAGRAQFLRAVDEEMMWAEEAPACLQAEEFCMPA